MNTKNFSLNFEPVCVGEGELPTQFTGTAYSGGVIPNYGWFGDVVIDLSSMKTPTKPIFALVNHDVDQRAGKCSIYNTGSAIEVSGTFSHRTSAGKQIAAEFSEGAPFEFSVGISAEFESFNKPASLEVNGQMVQVNGVFRNARVCEVSFVPAGADPNTHAVAFEKQELIENTMEYPMDLTELQEKVNSLTELNADLQTKLSVMQDDHHQVVTDLSAKMDDLSAKLELEMQRSKEYLDRSCALENELSEFKASVRMESIKSLFADLNKEFSEESASPYRNLSDEQFAVIAADLRSIQPIQMNADLFKELATHGKEQVNEVSLAAQLFNQVAGVK